MREYRSLRLLPKEFVKCPMDNTFEIIKKKYVFQIFREMYFAKQTRFSQFLELIDGINTKTLSLRLKEMEQSGLIDKKTQDNHPSKREYRISKKGLDLLPILEQMTAFSIKHEKDEVFEDKRFSNFKDAFGREPSTLKEKDSFSKKTKTKPNIS